MSGSDNDDGTRKRSTTGAIPLNWAMPAEVTAEAAGLNKRAPHADGMGAGKIAGIVVAFITLVIGGVVVGMNMDQRDGGAATIADGVTAPVNGAVTTTNLNNDGATTTVIGGDGGNSALGHALVGDGGRLDHAVDPTGTPLNRRDDGGETPIDPNEKRRDAGPDDDDDPAEGSPSDDAMAGLVEEIVPGEVPSLVLNELPVRKKARRLVESADNLIRQNRVRDAAPAARKAARLDPTYAIAFRTLGIAEARLGNVDAARKAYERYLEMAPDAPDAADVRRILGQ